MSEPRPRRQLGSPPKGRPCNRVRGMSGKTSSVASTAVPALRGGAERGLAPRELGLRPRHPREDVAAEAFQRLVAREPPRLREEGRREDDAVAEHGHEE